MPSINFDAFSKIIVLPDLSRHNLSPEKKAILETAIRKIKLEQLRHLSEDVMSLFDIFEGEENYKLLIQLSILDYPENIPLQQQLHNIFKLKSGQKDEALEKIISEYKLKDMAETISKLCHMYYLDKQEPVRNNPLAFWEKASERLLNKGYTQKKISPFLKGECDLLSEQGNALIKEVYPLPSLQNKTFRRKAHDDIVLSIFEIQSLILGFANAMLETGKVLKENLCPAVFSPSQNAHFLEYTQKPLFDLISENKLEDLKNILEQDKSKVNSISYYNGKSLLVYAIECEKFEIFKYLLEQKADGNIADDTNYGALHYAVESENIEFLRSLLATECNVNALDRGKYSAIYVACELGRADYVKLLLDTGADPNLNQNMYGNTALHIAVRNHQLKVVEVLLESNKVNSDLLDSKKKTALQLAMENNKDPKIVELIKNYKNPYLASNSNILNIISAGLTPETVVALVNTKKTVEEKRDLLGSLMKAVKEDKNRTQTDKNKDITILMQVYVKLLGVPNTPTASPLNKAFNKVPVAIPVNMKDILLNPTDQLNKQWLVNNQEKFANATNPFPFVINFGKKFPTQSIHTAYRDIMEYESSEPDKAKKQFFEIVDQLKDLARGKGGTFTECYHQILKMMVSIHEKGLSMLAFTFELFKANFVEILLNLAEQKSSMQVAIEGEDVDAIYIILKEQPNRIAERIFYEGKEFTEIEFARQMGKVEAIKTFVEASTKNAQYQLGPIPDDIVKLTENKKNEIANTAPGKREVQKYHGVEDKTYRVNIKKLLRELRDAVTKDEKTVHGLFTTEEYKVVKMIVAEKEIPKQHPLLRAVAKNQLLIEKLKKQKAVLSENLDLDIYKIVEEEYIGKVLESANDPSISPFKLKNHSDIRIKETHPRITNVLNHATNFVEKIQKSGELLSVEEAYISGKIPNRYTPEGARNNIFFSLSGVTPFRGMAKHVIVVKLAEALKQGLINPNDIYTSPHLSAFTTERTEPPIIFVGDPTKKTVLRVFHFKDKGEEKKGYRYDYYDNEKLIGTHLDINNKQDEFFLGDNIKTTGYRLISYLRKIQGPFTEGSYTHYFYANLDKVEVVEALRGALFDPLKVEAKLLKSLRVDNPDVVQFKVNERSKRYEELHPDIKTKVEQAIESNDLNEIKKVVEELAIFKEQLNFALIKAIKVKNIDIIRHLLDFGVNVNGEGSAALLLALNNMLDAYNKETQILDNPDFVKTYQIVSLLLHLGHVDETDPSHIRYTASIDSLGQIGQAIWTNTTPQNTKELKRLLLKIKNQAVQRFFLEGSCQYTHIIGLFAFNYGFVDLHKLAYSLLKMDSIYEREPIVTLMKAIDSNDVATLENHFKSIERTQDDRNFYLFANAIRLGKEEIVVKLYPYFVRTACKQFSALHLAIYFQQPKVALSLIELGADVNEKNLFGQTILEAAEEHKCTDILEHLLEKITDVNEAVLHSIRNKKYEYLKILSKRLDVSAIRDSNKGEGKGLAPLMTFAIKQKDISSVTILWEHYLSANPISTSSKKRSYYEGFKKVLITWVIEAIQCDARECFVFLINEILKDEKLISSLFTAQVQHLFGKIIYEQKLEFVSLALSVLKDSLSEKKLARILSSVDTGGLNIFLIAINLDELELLQLLRKELPKLSYFTKEITNNFKLLEFAFSTGPSPRLVEWLVSEDDISFPENMHDKAMLLCHAILNSDIDLIKFFFEKGYWKKEELSELNENYLQLIYKIFSEGQIKLGDGFDQKTTTKSLRPAFEALCQLPIDVNNKDKEGKTILQYDYQGALGPLSPLYVLKSMLSAVIKQENVALLVRDDKNNSILQTLNPSFISKTLLEKFVAQGGNINALDEEGVTAFEKYCLSGKSNKVKELFKTLGAQLRVVIPTQSKKYGLVIAKIDNVNHVLVKDKECFFFDLMFHKQYLDLGIKFHKVTVDDESIKTPYELGVLYLGETKEKPDIKLPASNLKWIKLPSNFSDSDGVMMVSDGSEIFRIGNAFKIMVEAYLQNSDWMKDKRKIILGKDVHQTLFESFQKAYIAFKEVCEAAIRKESDSFKKLCCIYQNNFDYIPYDCKLLEDDLYTYTDHQFFSPIDIITFTAQTELLNWALKQGFISYGSASNVDLSSLGYAIANLDPITFTILLNEMKNITSEVLNACLKHVYKEIWLWKSSPIARKMSEEKSKNFIAIVTEILENVLTRPFSLKIKKEILDTLEDCIRYMRNNFEDVDVTKLRSLKEACAKKKYSIEKKKNENIENDDEPTLVKKHKTNGQENSKKRAAKSEKEENDNKKSKLEDSNSNSSKSSDSDVKEEEKTPSRNKRKATSQPVVTSPKRYPGFFNNNSPSASTVLEFFKSQSTSSLPSPQTFFNTPQKKEEPKKPEPEKSKKDPDPSAKKGS